MSTPLMVAGLYISGRREIAKKAHGADTEIVVPEELLSQFIAQSVLQPGLWDVYAELFKTNARNAIYIKQNDQPDGMAFGELQRMFPDAMLLGRIPMNGGTPVLGPDCQHRVPGDDKLVFVARNFGDCAAQNSQVQSTDTARPSLFGKSIRQNPGKRRILILGWSRKAPGLMDALITQSGGEATLHNVGLSPIQKRQVDLGHWGQVASADNVKLTEANFLLPQVMESLKPWEYHNIIILARERLGDEAFADAATVTACLTLEHILEGHEQKPRFTLELVEEENAYLLEGKGYDIVLSPVIISYMLSQVALERELNSVFTELAGNQEIRALDLLSR